MRNVKEIIDYLKDRIKKTGMTQAEIFEKTGYSLTLFTMALKRNTYPRLETLVEFGKVLNVSITDILGIEEDPIPSDIKEMVTMLKSISPANRKMIAMNIENYFKVEMQGKAVK